MATPKQTEVLKLIVDPKVAADLDKKLSNLGVLHEVKDIGRGDNKLKVDAAPAPNQRGAYGQVLVDVILDK